MHDPLHAAGDATFDFLICLSLANKLGVVELVVWVKDTDRGVFGKGSITFG
jgi:hypothetical protein